MINRKSKISLFLFNTNNMNVNKKSSNLEVPSKFLSNYTKMYNVLLPYMV